jgi:SAM-dependent methyltransferase
MAASGARAFLRTVRDALRGIGDLPRLVRTREQVEYLNREVGRLNAAARRAAWRSGRRIGLEPQTKASFDFQWEHMPAGRALPSDPSFMAGLEQQLSTMLQVSRDWFSGKRVVDIGCGIGRYTYGFLKLGAAVTACDQSEAALRRTAELCREFAGRLTLERIDLLDWDEIAHYDVAFSFGVVHHTGNTYLAMENVCRKVKLGGRVFFMIYGVPDTLPGFREVNEYEQIAEETRDVSFDERKAIVERRFGPEAAHGWFDATSPRINDRLTFEEIHDVLTELGFDHIRRVVVARNHQIVAQRARPA